MLWGEPARLAHAAGLALPFAGGPGAFTLVRAANGVLPAAEAARRWPEPVARLTRAVPDWAGLGPGPLVMGILNVTPDSFSDGGRLDPAAAVAAGQAMLDAGADLLDLGGESTRPGATPVAPAEEQARILPVIAALAARGATLSVDTRNADTMARALGAGARIVNDVSALAWDPASAATVARAGCPVILMHMRGTPATMAGLTDYTDVAADVVAELASRLRVAEAAGIAPAAIALDPGFGFAKTADQDLDLLRRLPALATLGRPLLAGLSRKRTVGHLTGRPLPRDRDPGSTAVHLMALDRGARILRTHDVPATRQAVAVWKGVTA